MEEMVAVDSVSILVTLGPIEANMRERACVSGLGGWWVGGRYG